PGRYQLPPFFAILPSGYHHFSPALCAALPFKYHQPAAFFAILPLGYHQPAASRSTLPFGQRSGPARAGCAHAVETSFEIACSVPESVPAIRASADIIHSSMQSGLPPTGGTTSVRALVTTGITGACCCGPGTGTTT